MYRVSIVRSIRRGQGCTSEEACAVGDGLRFLARSGATAISIATRRPRKRATGQTLSAPGRLIGRRSAVCRASCSASWRGWTIYTKSERASAEAGPVFLIPIPQINQASHRRDDRAVVAHLTILLGSRLATPYLFYLLWRAAVPALDGPAGEALPASIKATASRERPLWDVTLLSIP